MSNKIEIFVNVEEKIDELDTVKEVLYSAIEKEAINVNNNGNLNCSALK